MPFRDRRRSERVEIRSFQWADAGAGTVLLRLVAVTPPDVDSSNVELIVKRGTVQVQSASPLPGPVGTGDELRVAFPVDAALVHDREAEFELALAEGPTFQLPFPEPLATSPPSRPRAERDASEEQSEIELLMHKLDRLREELHESRRRLGEAEARADEAYANQLMAEERSFEARNRASDAAARLERALEARETEREQGRAAITEARAAVDAARTEQAVAEQRKVELDRVVAELQRRLDAAGEEKRLLGTEVSSLRSRLAAAEAERAAPTRVAEPQRAAPKPSDDEAANLRLELELTQAAAVQIEAELQRTGAEVAAATARYVAAEAELRSGSAPGRRPQD